MTLCSSCGKQLASNKKFCTGCGAKVGVQSNLPTPPNVRQKAFPAANVGSGSSSTGQLLISGDGKYNLSSLIYWGLMIIADAVILVLGFELRDMVARAPRATFNRVPHVQIGTQTLTLEQAQTLSTFMIVIAILGLLAGAFFATWALRRYQSKISVYENVITGKNVQGFSPTLQEFSVPMADIMNVDVLKQTGVVVRTQYGTYTSYTKKADEVRNIIMSNI